MKSFVSTVVGGAIGLVALYVVGRVAYQAGRDVARAEQHYEEVRRKSVELETSRSETDGHVEESSAEKVKEMAVVEAVPVHKSSRLGLLMGIKRLAGKKESVIGKLVRHPESHRIEAFVEGEELHVNVKPRTA